MAAGSLSLTIEVSSTIGRPLAMVGGGGQGARALVVVRAVEQQVGGQPLEPAGPGDRAQPPSMGDRTPGTPARPGGPRPARRRERRCRAGGPRQRRGRGRLRKVGAGARTGAPTAATTANLGVGLGRQLAQEQGTPGLAMPAFSRAIAAQRPAQEVGVVEADAGDGGGHRARPRSPHPADRPGRSRGRPPRRRRRPWPETPAPWRSRSRSAARRWPRPPRPAPPADRRPPPAVDADALGEAAQVGRGVRGPCANPPRAGSPRSSRRSSPCRWCRRSAPRRSARSGDPRRASAARTRSRPKETPSVRAASSRARNRR